MDQSLKLTTNQALGKKGEQLAQKYLEKKGHIVINSNYRSGRSELDIISTQGSTLVVTEVKSFYSNPLGAAEFRITKKKQKQIMQGVYGFLDENPKYQGKDVRLDVIIVDFSSFPAKLTHHSSAFYDDDSYFY